MYSLKSRLFFISICSIRIRSRNRDIFKNLKKDGFTIDRILKPNLLITDGFNANYAHKRKRDRDEQLCQVTRMQLFSSFWLLSEISQILERISIEHVKQKNSLQIHCICSVGIASINRDNRGKLYHPKTGDY